MVARTPHMDWMAKHGDRFGQNSSWCFNPGSEIANLSISDMTPSVIIREGTFGSSKSWVKLESEDIAFRCNLVTLQFHKEKIVMKISPPDISQVMKQESSYLIWIEKWGRMPSDSIRGQFTGIWWWWRMGLPDFQIWKNLIDSTHDILDKEISPFLSWIQRDWRFPKLWERWRGSNSKVDEWFPKDSSKPSGQSCPGGKRAFGG